MHLAYLSLGVSEMEARRYERELDNGNILLCVHTDDAGDIARAKDIFKEAAPKTFATRVTPKRGSAPNPKVDRIRSRRL